MGKLKRLRVLAAAVLVVVLAVFVGYRLTVVAAPPGLPTKPSARTHVSHASFFDTPFRTGQEVTRACLECHEASAKEMLRTAHFRWEGEPVDVKGDGKKIRIGKRNLINNFCIGVQGNFASCTRCHAGYGWEDKSYDFSKEENVDCLVCHDRSGTYLKGAAGLPRKGVNLQAAAKSVGFPRRDNCGVCHHYGGGGLGVKHGDLDATLDNPDPYDDVHMGRGGLLCIDCHGGDKHNIRGKAYSVSVNHENGIGCTDCHKAAPHQDSRLNQHTQRVACQTCHIPTFASNVPTKTDWDWSKAGDDKREDDTHHYLKIKGEFIYKKSLQPEYYWFDLTADRYLLGDKVADHGPTDINRPRGKRGSPGAKIWPFKVHRGKQPYDPVNQHIIPPVTSGEGGYWHDFDWPKALRLGAAQVGLPFSGKVGFVQTEMFWPLSHMVQPKDKALQCIDCHGAGSRMEWQRLGYADDPMNTGAGSSPVVPTRTPTAPRTTGGAR